MVRAIHSHHSPVCHQAERHYLGNDLLPRQRQVEQAEAEAAMTEIHSALVLVSSAMEPIMVHYLVAPMTTMEHQALPQQPDRKYHSYN